MIRKRPSLCVSAACFELAAAAETGIRGRIARTLLVPENLALMMSVNMPEADKVSCADSA
jgi:hypothetical protein